MGVLLAAYELTRTLPEEIPVTLVNGVSLTIESGAFTAITGPSGSGKSSLLYLLSLLDRPTSGKIEIEGQDTAGLDDDAIAAIRLSRMGFVFQSHFLLPEFSARENLMLPMQRLSLDQPRERADRILEKLGLAEHAHKLPSQLSGGQRQRVAIGRALANDPAIIFADEPTGNLDSVSAASVQKLMRDIAHAEGRAVVAVTHDPAFAATADRRFHIVDGKLAAVP